MMVVTAITVLGDHGYEYTVRVEMNGQVHCSCPAFKFRPDVACKHIRFLEQRVAQAVMAS